MVRATEEDISRGGLDTRILFRLLLINHSIYYSFLFLPATTIVSLHVMYLGPVDKQCMWSLLISLLVLFVMYVYGCD